MTTLLRILFPFLLACAFFSCVDEEISHSSAYIPTVSSDTVRFDTIFTDITSTTRVVKIYNRNGKDINLDFVQLMGGATSPFKINVNGQQNAAQIFQDVRINAHDSVYLFVQITPNTNYSNLPVLVADSILLSCNGTQQKIQLLAVGQDVNVLDNFTVLSDTTLKDEKPYLVYGTLDVTAGNTLTIAAGVKMYFHHKAVIKVHGTIKMTGTTDKKITLAGDRLDNMPGDVPYDSLANQWDGIEIYGQGPHFFYNVDMHSGEHGIDAWNDTAFTPQITISQCRIHNFGGYGVVGQNTNFEIDNSFVTNCGIASLYLCGGKINATHCTFANYGSIHSGKTLKIYNNTEQRDCPLYKVYFSNCAVIGSKPDELDFSTGDADLSSICSFTNCAIKGDTRTDSYFTNCHFVNGDGNLFFTNTTRYPYDFTLCDQSPLIGAADVTIASTFPYDYFGRYRLTDTHPDIGAAEK